MTRAERCPVSIFDSGTCNWRPKVIQHKGRPLVYDRSMDEHPSRGRRDDWPSANTSWRDELTKPILRKRSRYQ